MAFNLILETSNNSNNSENIQFLVTVLRKWAY